MPRKQRVLGGASLLLLLAGAILFVGCSDDNGTTPTGSSTSQTTAVVVQTDPDDLNVGWTLALPDGGTVASTGDASQTGVSSGDYTISWEPREGWVSPYPNPETLTIGASRQIDFLGFYYLEPGSIFINVVPGDLQAQWQVTAEDNTTWTGSGDATLFDLEPGDYEIEWWPVDGWTTPDLDDDEQGDTYVESITLTIFGATATRTYRQAANSIYITPLPGDLDAPWSLEGRAPIEEGGSPQLLLEESGTGMAILTDRWPAAIPDSLSSATMTVSVTWGDVDGWYTPDAQTASMGLGESLAFSAQYAPVTGSIEIDVQPSGLDAPWTLSGPDGSIRAGEGDASLTGLLPGEYTIAWNALTAWSAPAGSTHSVVAGGSATFSGTYSPGLVILPLPEGFAAPWTLTGSGGFSQSGTGGTTFNGLDAGSYTLTWGAVDGWATPAAQTVSLGSQGQVVSSEYTQNSMTLFVRPEPAGLGVPWTLTGPGGFSQSGNGQGTVTVANAGVYALTWGDLGGYTTPGPIVAALATGQNLTFEGLYLEALDFASIAPGNYYMGNAFSCRGADETRHYVALTRHFRMQTTEMPLGSFVEIMQWAVDNGYARLEGDRVYDTLDNSTRMLVNLGDPGLGIAVDANGRFSTATPDMPVTEISWYAAASACDWLSLHAGLVRAYDHADWFCNGVDPSGAIGYRLPTEAEWEYACRAGTTTAWAFSAITGSLSTGTCAVSDPAALDSGSWYGVNSGAEAHEVALKAPNAWGLFDMHGNVREWCNDRYRSNYCPISGCPARSTDPAGPSRGETRVQRGGYFYSQFMQTRSFARAEDDPENATGICGFRVVITDH